MPQRFSFLVKYLLVAAIAVAQLAAGTAQASALTGPETCHIAVADDTPCKMPHAPCPGDRCAAHFVVPFIPHPADASVPRMKGRDRSYGHPHILRFRLSADLLRPPKH